MFPEFARCLCAGDCPFEVRNCNNLHLVDIRTIRIPLPPLETQQTIVADIEAEQALVKGNRDQIARFEKKIDAAIARVWGEAKGEDAA